MLVKNLFLLLGINLILFQNHFYYYIYYYRRIRKTDNERISRVTGAKIINRPEELEEKFVGTRCGLFEIKLIGDEYFTFMTECKVRIIYNIYIY